MKLTQAIKEGELVNVRLSQPKTGGDILFAGAKLHRFDFEPETTMIRDGAMAVRGKRFAIVRLEFVVEDDE